MAWRELWVVPRDQMKKALVCFPTPNIQIRYSKICQCPFPVEGYQIGQASTDNQCPKKLVRQLITLDLEIFCTYSQLALREAAGQIVYHSIEKPYLRRIHCHTSCPVEGLSRV